MIKRARRDDPTSVKELELRDNRETTFGLKNLIKNANFSLLNNSSIKMLEMKVKTIVEKIIKNLQTELEALGDSTDQEESSSLKQEVQIIISGNYDTLSAERKSAAIDAFAAIIGIPSQHVKVYHVYEGSIVFDLEIPLEAVQRLRSRRC